DWAKACTENQVVASAAFDEDLTVVAWNENMEALMGIRAQYAIGADLAGASRDTGFESALRELTGQAQQHPWTPYQIETEISGNAVRLFLIYGQGAYLMQIAPTGEA